MDAQGGTTSGAITTRCYTGRSRAEAEAGFKIDWPGMASRYTVVGQGWDDQTHTLTVMLKRLPAPSAPSGRVAGS